MKYNLNPWWLVGLVDGIGNFEILDDSLKFSIRLDKEDYQVLSKVKGFFGCGKIKKDGVFVDYFVTDLKHIDEKIRPFFEKYTPKSKLKISWIKFRRVHIWLIRKKADQEGEILLSEKVRHLKNSGFKRESKPL